MWQLVQPPFPEHPILPIVQGFDLTQSLYVDQNKIKERKEKATIKSLEQNQLKVYQYTLYLYFIKVIQYIISPELQQQSFATVKSQTDIFNIIKSGYLFGQFINIIYDKHNTYEPRPNKIQRQQNWKKIISVLRQDPALRYEHLFPEDEVFEEEALLNALFFKILEDLIQLFLDKREMLRLKEFTQQLFLQCASKRNLTEDQTRQMLADEDFPVYLSEQLQKHEYPVNKPVELQSSMETYLSHYSIPNTLFNNDENWRNGYYFYILIKEIIFQKFKVQFPYKLSNVQYKSLSMTQSMSQTKQQLSLHQIAANLSNICDFFNQNQITQNMSVYDLQNGGYNVYQEIVSNIMKQYPYLKPINSQYDETEIKLVKRKIILELKWCEVIDERRWEQLSGNAFTFITDLVRSGTLTFDYLEHLFHVQAIKTESISSFFQSSPYVNRADPDQMNKQILKYIQNVMKLTPKYSHHHLTNASEELVVDFLELLITYKYHKLSDISKTTFNLHKFMLQYYDQFSLFLEHPVEKKRVVPDSIIEEESACIIGSNELYIDGINVDGLQMVYIQPLDFEFLQ